MISGALLGDFALLWGTLGAPRAKKEGSENHQNQEKTVFNDFGFSCSRLGFQLLFEAWGPSRGEKGVFGKVLFFGVSLEKRVFRCCFFRCFLVLEMTSKILPKINRNRVQSRKRTPSEMLFLLK